MAWGQYVYPYGHIHLRIKITSFAIHYHNEMEDKNKTKSHQNDQSGWPRTMRGSLSVALAAEALVPVANIQDHSIHVQETHYILLSLIVIKIKSNKPLSLIYTIPFSRLTLMLITCFWSLSVADCDVSMDLSDCSLSCYLFSFNIL